MTLREELLQLDGVGRIVLERRIVALVRVLDAATELIAADDAAQQATSIEEDGADERYEQAWEQLRSVLKSV
jgi:hypothetical protein